MITGLSQQVLRLRFAVDNGAGGTNTPVKLDPDGDRTNASTISLQTVRTGTGLTLVNGEVAVTQPIPPPVANFTASPRSGRPDPELFVKFTDTSTGDITSRDWDFGDGGSSSSTNPGHNYDSSEQYTVRLTVTGPGGSDTETKINYITVEANQPPEIDDVTGDRTVLLNETITLEVVASDDADSPDEMEYFVSDRDEERIPDVQVSGSRITLFPKPNTIFSTQIKIRVRDSEGALSSKETITLEWERLPIAGTFTADPVSLFEGGTTQFTFNRFRGSIDSYDWNFGDGRSSTAENPSHTYDTEGVYTVSLTIEGEGVTVTITKQDYIQVDRHLPPDVFFAAEPTSGLVDLRVDFSLFLGDGGPIDSYLWDFGDGGSSTEQNPSHTYTEPGTYPVSVLVIGPGGDNEIIQEDYIRVDALPPNGIIDADPIALLVDESVDFTFTILQNSGPIDSYLWDFGDDGSSTEQNPSHTYTEPETYTVSCTVTGDIVKSCG